jgi:hypothetical protein
MKVSTSQSPRKSSPFPVCAMACLILAAGPSALALQHISVGIKAGVPLMDAVESESNPLLFQAQTKRYTIGPVVNIGLPLGFGIEFGAMYKHFDQKSMTITTTGFTFTPDGESDPIQQVGAISTAGQSWEFPVAGQYHLSKSAIRPYVEGGVSFNHLSSVYNFESFFTGLLGPRPLPFTLGPTIGSFNRIGGLFGLGVDLKLLKMHVTPGFRYTHYSDKTQWLPAANAVDCLVGFAF